MGFTWASEWILAGSAEEEAAKAARQWLQPDDGPESPEPMEEEDPVFPPGFPNCLHPQDPYNPLHTDICGRFPPEVRTSIPVDGRFEHIVLSCNATSDHAIISIEREAQKALELLKGKSCEPVTRPPKIQKFERLQSIEKEHKDVLQRAVSLKIPHAVTMTIDDDEKEPLTKTVQEFSDNFIKEDLKHENENENENGDGDTSHTKPKRANWNDLVEKLLRPPISGN